ncbi:VCBS domain-containing protein [Aeromonas hydrophila]|uniref:VCBS domain-containing protein n=1 Tax=Aeromonas hydrophila TaxID=644 RepID=UPI0023798947|nr:VCBS domain-containing protein [Aeromonas hydrophila]MDD9226611.1 VCBS domain-containing protein [Aeromonas hydrophila]
MWSSPWTAPTHVTVTITGTSDKAIISGDAEGAVTEGNGNIVLSDSGTLTAVDVDGKDADNTFRTDVAVAPRPRVPRWAA